MAVRRLHMISPATARNLFRATVVPVVDHAAGVWMHTITQPLAKALNRVQRVGAQAVTGVFSTVALAVREAEASICPIAGRYREKAIRLWMNLKTLPKTNPLTKLPYQGLPEIHLTSAEAGSRSL
jgi:hypothetical protein